MEKYCTPGQATDDNIGRRMRIVCWIPKAEHKLSICDTYISPMQQRFTNAPKRHVIRTLLVLLQPKCSVFTARYGMELYVEFRLALKTSH